jgi:hypothetical protein
MLDGGLGVKLSMYLLQSINNFTFVKLGVQLSSDFEHLELGMHIGSFFLYAYWIILSLCRNCFTRWTHVCRNCFTMLSVLFCSSVELALGRESSVYWYGDVKMPYN